MDSVRMDDLNRVSHLSEVYEALDNCIELERALSRLARADAIAADDWKASRAEVHGICARVEQRLEHDA